MHIFASFKDNKDLLRKISIKLFFPTSSTLNVECTGFNQFTHCAMLSDNFCSKNLSKLSQNTSICCFPQRALVATWKGLQMLQLTPTTTYLSIWQTLSALKSVFDTNFHSIVIKSPGLTHHQLCLPQKTLSHHGITITITYIAFWFPQPFVFSTKQIWMRYYGNNRFPGEILEPFTGKSEHPLRKVKWKWHTRKLRHTE